MNSNRSKTIFAQVCKLSLGLIVYAGVAQGATLSKFTGGDVGEGLDLKNDEGGFVYALNLRSTSGSDVTVGDVTFKSTTASSAPAGVTVVSYYSPFDTLVSIGAPNPFTFGASANDNNLETVMDSGALANTGTFKFQLSLAVTTGKAYKLQLLMFANSGAHRPANYTIDGAGTTFIDIPSDSSAYSNASYVVTELFTATNSTETITIAWTGAGSSNQSIIHGLTLEYIPEPTIIALLGLGGLLLLRRKR